MERDVLMKDVVKILEELTGDWETAYRGPIEPETTLIGDLAFESIDIVQMGAALDEHFGQDGLPFEKLLMADGRYVDDLRVGDVVDFLCAYLRP